MCMYLKRYIVGKKISALVEALDNFGGYSGNECVIGNIVCNDGASSNARPFSDADSL
jgi:hypothetical protein